MAIELNELEEGVALTDSRLRPDQRYMETGDWDQANKVKVMLEEKQRAVRRKREQESAEAAAQGNPTTTEAAAGSESHGRVMFTQGLCW